MQIQTLKSSKSVTCNYAYQKTHVFSKVNQQVLNGGPEKHPKSIEIQTWNPRVSLLGLPSPPESPDGPPRCQIGRFKHGKRQVLLAQTDIIRAPNHCGL